MTCEYLNLALILFTFIILFVRRATNPQEVSGAALPQTIIRQGVLIRMRQQPPRSLLRHV